MDHKVCSTYTLDIAGITLRNKRLYKINETLVTNKPAIVFYLQTTLSKKLNTRCGARVRINKFIFQKTT